MSESIFLLPSVSQEQRFALKSRIEQLSQPSSQYFILLSGAALIASVGLFQNSSAVVIGSMIIAPLLRPLIGISFGALTADAPMLRRAAFTLAAGSVVGCVIAYLVGSALLSIHYTPEILARTNPTMLDLAVAVVAGAIGAYCQTNQKLGDTLSGVAIAVALVPPLSVVGIGLADQSFSVWSGAALLYLTNIVGIVISGTLTFVIMGYAPLQKARRGLAAGALVVALLAVMLGSNTHGLFS